ncbi:hypothetical protein CVT24_004671 [Panaeolus cyanescens]|uniref:BTB domain-containing protein n=1 Tax=Panaeolus cyanescens TaxID=181874 RepID=A0A409X3K3_9AGAR|nr:hypothetical protein CVT24_004671 [Panaeolus cyanescens]
MDTMGFLNNSITDIDIDTVIDNTLPTNEPEMDGEFDAKIVVFKVEKTLFSVLQSAIMCPGSFFETLFSLPIPCTDECSPDSFVIEGNSKDNPIVLENISAADFRSFLRRLFPLEGFSKCKRNEEFFGALGLANMWDFKKMRTQIIKRMTPAVKLLPFQDQILLGKKYEVKSWLQHGYEAAVRNKEPLSVVQMAEAGIDLNTIGTLVTIRDSWFYAAVFNKEAKCIPSIQQNCSSHAHVLRYRCATCSGFTGVANELNPNLEGNSNGMTQSRATELVVKSFSTEFSSMRND